MHIVLKRGSIDKLLTFNNGLYTTTHFSYYIVLFISYICMQGVFNPNILIGERSEPPLSVELSEFSLYLLYIIFQAVRRARAVNAQMSDQPVEVQWLI